MIQIKNAVGRVSATYKTSDGTSISEPLSYTNWNIADSASTIASYSEAIGSEVTVNKTDIAFAINTLAKNIASLTDGNTHTGTKVNYEVEIYETT